MLKKVFSIILGEKKVSVIEFLCQNADENGLVKFTIAEICDKLKTSKPTVLETFKLLEHKKILFRVKNGLYKITI